MKTVAAVLAGYILWTSLWLGGNAGLRVAGLLPAEPAAPVTGLGSLLGLMVLSLMCSLAAGSLTAAIGRAAPGRGLVALALALFATGCLVQFSVRNLFPVWYHLSFMGLLIPATFVGGRFVRRSP